MMPAAARRWRWRKHSSRRAEDQIRHPDRACRDGIWPRCAGLSGPSATMSPLCAITTCSTPRLRAKSAWTWRCSGSPWAGHRDLRPQPVIELRDFAPARMARAMDQRVAVGDHLDALQDQAVDDGVHLPLVAGNGARGENDEIAGRELDGDARRARCATWPRAPRPGCRWPARRPCSRGSARKTVQREQFRNAVEIAAFARDLDRPLHGAAGEHDAPPRGLRRQADRAQPRDIGGEGRDHDAARRAARIFSRSTAATCASDGLSPSRRILVESQMSARTPSSPICFSRVSSVGRPRPGVGSIFQSPVWTTTPGLGADRRAGSIRGSNATSARIRSRTGRGSAATPCATIIDRHLRRAGLGEPRASRAGRRRKRVA